MYIECPSNGWNLSISRDELWTSLSKWQTNGKTEPKRLNSIMNKGQSDFVLQHIALKLF